MADKFTAALMRRWRDVGGVEVDLKTLADFGLSPVWVALIWVIHRLGGLVGAALLSIHTTLTRLETKLEEMTNGKKDPPG